MHGYIHTFYNIMWEHTHKYTRAHQQGEEIKLKTPQMVYRQPTDQFQDLHFSKSSFSACLFVYGGRNNNVPPQPGSERSLQARTASRGIWGVRLRLQGPGWCSEVRWPEGDVINWFYEPKHYAWLHYFLKNNMKTTRGVFYVFDTFMFHR